MTDYPEEHPRRHSNLDERDPAYNERPAYDDEGCDCKWCVELREEPANGSI